MQRISTEHVYILGLLEQLVNRKEHESTILIICWSRKDFFTQLFQQPLQRNDGFHAVPSSQQSEETTSDGGLSGRHLFLTPSLQLLASSRSVKLAFCPSVPTLRAYLSAFLTNNVSDPLPQQASPRLLVLDLLALHHGTSEFTLQGLSRSFASAVSAAHRTHLSLTLLECKDINDPSNPARGPSLWNAQVPLLSGSVKIAQEGVRWAGRSISIRSIAARWFTFEDNTQSETDSRMGLMKQEDADEMLI